MRLCWLDLETTGLDTRACHVLEVAMVITDHELNPLATKNLVLEASSDALKHLQLEANKVALEMHQQSGLLLECASSSLTLKVVDQFLCSFLTPYQELEIDAEGKPTGKMVPPIVAGRNVGVYDLPIFRRCFPEASKLLHYRTLDVRTFRTVLRMLGKEPEGEQRHHRAMTDLLQDIAFADWFINRMMVD